MVKIGLRSLTESEFLSLLKHQNENISVKGGYRDIDIFKSQRRIRSGGSIFSFLGNIGRKALPFISKYILPSVKELGKGVVTDVIKGENIKHSIKKRGKQSLKRLGARVLSGKGKRTQFRNRKKLLKMNRSKIKKGGYKKKRRLKTKFKKKRKGAGAKRSCKSRKGRQTQRHKKTKKCKSKFNDILS